MVEITKVAPSEIESLSFEIIEEEAGDHGLKAAEWAVVRRLIHTTADFDFIDKNRGTRYGQAEARAKVATKGTKLRAKKFKKLKKKKLSKAAKHKYKKLKLNKKRTKARLSKKSTRSRMIAAKRLLKQRSPSKTQTSPRDDQRILGWQGNRNRPCPLHCHRTGTPVNRRSPRDG